MMQCADDHTEMDRVEKWNEPKMKIHYFSDAWKLAAVEKQNVSLTCINPKNYIFFVQQCEQSPYTQKIVKRTAKVIRRHKSSKSIIIGKLAMVLYSVY